MVQEQGQGWRPYCHTTRAHKRSARRRLLACEGLESRHLLAIGAALPTLPPIGYAGTTDHVGTENEGGWIPPGVEFANTFDFGPSLPSGAPIQFRSIAPLGSLIYDPPIDGNIGEAGEVDTYPMSYDTGQTLTIVVIPSASLRPSIMVSGPLSAPQSETQESPAAGTPVVIQAHPTQAGNYEINVRGVDGTTGNYTIEFILNALIEEESISLGLNDSPSSAQSIDNSFLSLGIGDAERGALLGITDRASSIVYAADMELDPGWTLQGGVGAWEHGRPTGNGDRDPLGGFTGTKVVGFNLAGNYAANMPALYATTPRMDITGQRDVRLSFRRWLHVEGPSSDHATIEASNNGTDWTVVWQNETAIHDVEWALQEIDLSSVTANETGLYLRWGMGSTDGTLQYGGWNIDDVVVASSGTGQADWYRLTLEDGEFATIAATPLNAGDIDLALYNGAGDQRLAEDIILAGQTRTIPAFVDGTNDGLPTEYLIKISGNGAQYSLLVTKEVDFQSEPNNSPPEAQLLHQARDNSLAAVGYVSDAADSPSDIDLYAFSAVSNATLRVTLTVPGGGPGEPVNELIPHGTLITPSGVELPVTGSFELQATESGQYLLRISAENQSAGAYALRVEGGDSIVPPFSVLGTDWDTALSGDKKREQIIVAFTENVLLTTLEASDLLLNGVPATGLTIVDGRTAIFDLPDAYVEGLNTISIPGGTIANLQASAVESFILQYELDATGPVIIEISVADGEAVATGDVAIVIRFDEDIRFEQIDSHDISLVGTITGSREYASISYDDVNNQLSVLYRDLIEESYTLTLLSGDGRFENIGGLDLDGETNGTAVPPGLSGDGVAGGNFVWHFIGDIVTVPFVGEFTSIAPLGALAYEAEWGATIGANDTSDQLLVTLDPSQSMTLLVSTLGGLRPEIALWRDSEPVLATAVATAVGGTAVLSNVILPSGGDYIIQVRGVDGTTGPFSVRMLLNTGFEHEAIGGPENYFPTAAEDLDPYFTAAGSNNVSRVAVLGQTESGTLPVAPRLVNFNATWRYLDNGSDQGVAWREANFDDATWGTGPAQLGYGDGDEATVVGFGPDEQNKFATTYLRHAFEFDHDTTRFDKLVLDVLRDDGIAVYLNGFEIVRDNLSAVADFSTFAEQSITGAAESEAVRFEIALQDLPVGLLRRGSNILAVELHQQAADSSDISFDLQLDVVDVLSTTSDFGSLDFVNEGAIWRFLDDGSDQGTAWRNPTYDDTSWNSGPAELGYGEDDEATVVSFGNDAENKHITTYLRHSFAINGNPALLEQLILRLQRDDGAAVYLNGHEIARDNLIANATAFELATDPVTGVDEAGFVEFRVNVSDLPEGVLRRGANLLAVELHQQSPDSSDISFDLSLSGVLTNTNTVDQEDWYSFQLNDGESVTVGLQLLTAGSVSLGLFNAAGDSQLATSVATPNVTHLIQHFRDTTTDGLPQTYTIQIDGDPAEYHLFVVRNAHFDVDPNRNIAEAQPATVVLGAIAGLSSDATTVRTDFAGISALQTSCNCEPPDTHVAAGPNHIVEVVNTAIAVYHKDGTVATAPQELADFFTDALYRSDRFDFDPVVSYDSQAERWIVVVLVGTVPSAAETDLLYAISDTSDPTGPWTEKHRIDFGGISPGLFADYPKIGWNADAHVVSLNMFGPRDFVYVNLLSIDKSSVLDRDPATLRSFISSRPADNFTMAVATMHDARPGDPMWFVEEATFGGGNTIRLVKMSSLLSEQPTFRQFDVPVNSYSLPVGGTQLFGQVATGDARILNAEWRDGRLVATHNIGVNGKTAARWYEFDTTGLVPTLAQSATIDGGPGVHTYYPSIAINRRGDIGIDYMRSSSSELISMHVVGQSAGAAPGTMSQPVLVKNSERPYLGRRAGDYSGISVDPVTDSFWAANQVMPDIGTGIDWSTWIAEFSVAEIVEEDWYSFYAVTGDHLVVHADLPGGGGGQPGNEFRPKLELYDPDGSVVASNNDELFGELTLLPFDVQVPGEYRVRVASGNQRHGDYLLTVTGATGDGARPAVVDIDPFDGKRLLQFPQSLRMTFSEPLLIASLTADDLRIGGLPAVSLTVIDGRTVSFELDPLANIGEGIYVVELADGAVKDLVGTPNVAFDSTFVIDQSGPRILATLWNGAALPSQPVFANGDLTIELQFDEPLFTLSSPRRGLRSPGTEDVILTNGVGTVIPAQSLSFDQQTNRFSISFADLEASEYHLRIVSGDGAFEDVLGTNLDGESIGSNLDGTQTGDGVPGGDFTIAFAVDSTLFQLDTFDALRPLGSLASRYRSTYQLESDRRLHQFELSAGIGETVTVVVTPVDGTTTLSLNGISASMPGDPVVAEVRAMSTGRLLFDLRGTSPTEYHLEVYREAVWEKVVGDTTESHSVDLDDYLLPVGGGLVTAVGRSELVAPYSFSVFRESFDAGLGDFTIDNGFQSGSGLWHLSTGRSTDEQLGHSPPHALYYGEEEGSAGGGNYDTGTPHAGAVFTPTILLPLADSLVLTFQHLLDRHSDTLGDIAEVAINDGSGFVGLRSTALESLTSSTNGQWQTESIDLTAYAGSAVQLRFSFDSVDELHNLFEGWYLDDIEIIAHNGGGPDVDFYQIDLTPVAGRTVDIVVAGQDGVDFSTALIELIDSVGNVVATATSVGPAAEITNFDTAILDFEIPAVVAGDYMIRVTSDIAGDYALVVSFDAVFDTESNDEPGIELRRIQDSGFVIGHLDADSDPLDYVVIDLDPGQAMLVRVSTNLLPERAVSDLELTVTVQSPESTIYQPLGFSSNLSNSVIVLSFNEFADIAEIRASSGSGSYLVEFYLAVISGDFDRNGSWNCTDIDQLTTSIVSGDDDAEFDMSGDGIVDQTDLILWLAEANQKNLAPGQFYRPGDANLDGSVDATDFGVWESNRFTPTPGWCQGDFNVNGMVDVSDFNIWLGNRFTPPSEPAAASLGPSDDARARRTPRAASPNGLPALSLTNETVILQPIQVNGNDIASRQTAPTDTTNVTRFPLSEGQPNPGREFQAMNRTRFHAVPRSNRNLAKDLGISSQSSDWKDNVDQLFEQLGNG